MYPHRKANIRLVQHCAAISAIVEFVLPLKPLISDPMVGMTTTVARLKNYN